MNDMEFFTWLAVVISIAALFGMWVLTSINHMPDQPEKPKDMARKDHYRRWEDYL